MIYLILVLTLVHALREWQQGLADFLAVAVGFARRRWLPFALLAGALAATWLPIALGLVWPEHQDALFEIAAGSLLADAVITHLAASWIARRLAPATSPDVLLQIAAAAWLATSGSPLWLVGPLAFLGLWGMLLLFSVRDEAKVAADPAADDAELARCRELVRKLKQIPGAKVHYAELGGRRVSLRVEMTGEGWDQYVKGNHDAA